VLGEGRVCSAAIRMGGRLSPCLSRRTNPTRLEAMTAVIQDAIAAHTASGVFFLICNKPQARDFLRIAEMAIHRFHDGHSGSIPSRFSGKLYLEQQISRRVAIGQHTGSAQPAQNPAVALTAPIPYAHREVSGRTAMTKYRMLVFKSRLLWRSHDISASDDATAKGLAQQRFDELAAELRGRRYPRINNPAPARFILYDGVRVVCEVVAGE
jgi:hypothetical protein